MKVVGVEIKGVTALSKDIRTGVKVGISTYTRHLLLTLPFL